MTDLVDRQREHLLFTWTAQSKARPLEIVDADGARFREASAGWMWDLESQVYNVNVGHKHPHVIARMVEQIESLPACAPNAVLPIRARLGELLAEKTGLEKAFLTTGGSEAVEIIHSQSSVNHSTSWNPVQQLPSMFGFRSFEEEMEVGKPETDPPG